MFPRRLVNVSSFRVNTTEKYFFYLCFKKLESQKEQNEMLLHKLCVSNFYFGESWVKCSYFFLYSFIYFTAENSAHVE